jgi:hypothetical protein
MRKRSGYWYCHKSNSLWRNHSDGKKAEDDRSELIFLLKNYFPVCTADTKIYPG